MSASAKEWSFIIIFFVCFLLVTAGEIFWLYRSGSLDFRKSFMFAFTSNAFSVTVGFFISVIVFGALFAMIWGGSIEQLPERGLTLWSLLAVAAIIPVVLLVFVKRALFRLLNMPATASVVRSPGLWAYSVMASMLFFLLVLGGPGVFLYVF